MQTERSYWPDWAQKLQRWGLKEPAAFILDAVGPVGIFLAQLVYASQPFVGTATRQWGALGAMLENRDDLKNFAAFLQEDDSR
jgi:hypothetical protein